MVDVGGDYSKNPWQWEIHKISNEAGECVIHHKAVGRRPHDTSRIRHWVGEAWISHGHGSLLLSHDLTVKYLEDFKPYLLLKMSQTRRDLKRCIRIAPGDNTHTRAYTSVNSSMNMHGSWWNSHLLVRLGGVRDILCPSNAPSIPFVTDNPSKFEKYVTEVDRQHSRCIRASFWPNYPYNEVNNWSRDVFARRR